MVNSVVMGWQPLIPRHSGTRARSRTRNLDIVAKDSGFSAFALPRNDVAASLLGLAGVFYGPEGLELDIVKFAVDLLDLADVDVLHDVAGFRIDRDRAARACPLHTLHGANQRIAIRFSARLLQRLVDEVNAVIAAH